MATGQGLGRERQGSVETLLAEEARSPFDPARGPLLRARVLSSPTGAQALLLTAPSVIADAASLVEIVRELRSQGAGEDEPLQYADYAEWRNEAAGEAPAQESDDDAASSPTLLFGRAQSREEPYIVQTVELPVSAELAAALAAAASTLNAPTALMVEACWHACVHRLSGAGTVVMAGVTSGRSYAELAGAVGAFAQPLEVRTRFESGTSLPEIVDQVRRTREDGERRYQGVTGAELERLVQRATLSFQSCRRSASWRRAARSAGTDLTICTAAVLDRGG